MESRKGDHIELAFSSQVEQILADRRFNYEPLLGYNDVKGLTPFTFLGKTLQIPMWVSSMTGGTKLARTINTNLAQACQEFGMGMGLGSCRILMQDKAYLPDFDMRDIIGNDLPLYANIGIAQLEEMALQGSFQPLVDLVGLLRADGLIIHVNPLQEWLQDEGDRLKQPPLVTIQAFLEAVTMKVIVKEVGQGMGPESIRQLLQLPIEAFELAALGGTNFSKIELFRSNPVKQDIFNAVSMIGHSADEMVSLINEMSEQQTFNCRQLIISGGIKSFLDGYYLLSKSKLPAVYGQASNFLKYARGDYRELKIFVEMQIQGLQFAHAFLRPKL
ncbi:MAG: hypothetical protein AB9842_03850 [Bacteroidales bacterium]